MPGKREETSERKKEHIEICLNKEVSFKAKGNGLDNYDFIHSAVTEVDINKINFTSNFLRKKISYPFLISCMTGGTFDSININKELALAAGELNIPIGVGSQRQALENDNYIKSFKVIRQSAGNVPVLGNIGAKQIVTAKNPADLINRLADMVDASAVVIHLNPLQELFQKNGETDFGGLIKSVEKACRGGRVPVFAKEVGSGISGIAASSLLNAGIKGIDVAGAGGTSWSAVEMYRNGNYDEYFRDWGLTTSYCIKEVYKLKKKYKFELIASGGINSGIDVAKGLALGADMAASARIILKEVIKNGNRGVVNLIENWFNTVAKIMYLTGSKDLDSFRKNKLIKKEELV